jgi:hypothetical protein
VSGCSNASTSWLLLSVGPGQEETVLCSPDLLAAQLDAGIAADEGNEAADASDKRVLPFDHVYPVNRMGASPQAVATLYSTIGTTEFAAFHALLKPKAEAGELRCVRWFGSVLFAPCVLYCIGRSIDLVDEATTNLIELL